MPRRRVADGRKFQEHEVRLILERAIGEDESTAPALPARDGLTLRELQDVGREIGISPERISDAIAAIEGRGTAVAPTRTLGMPTAIGRMVALPRVPDDREWERLVAELRTTFGVPGEISSQGTLREWSHGTLHAFVEPTADGYRLRLTDSREGAFGVGLLFGGMLLAFSVLILMTILSKGDPGYKLMVPIFFALGGGGVVGASVLTLPGWARAQEDRMERICTFASAMLAAPSPTDE